ncbi:bifunctional nuclease family protein [Empedobacter stercoris]|uniref:bifunctional nuclease family protein n=1 Tax=Empedobacter TaxID=59734 RepID=UPI001CE1120A|nr:MULTISPECIES: bifunctional nuclease family protein [Empedobacter]MCA4777005.1 bifunctional nuclease family protein [Empedobacter stercoris]MCA4782316.1 bifunctional nuclease family protein [Empedobacter stercoris]MDM1523982.1 bifunctional nuclease family protein [Empedobacter sp. 225-1]MDM1543925.1 bifunctional nuclease family protein [Empedobacter sp. 189-2]UWX66566.1 bifunctional nuclease family protein [Empedobacter stercoris]
MDNLIRLNIKGISYSQTQTGAYALILEESVGGRKLPIIIGSFEAQSIALALEKDINPPRPLTHDLFVSLGKEFRLNVDSIYIYKLEDGVFYSNIVFLNEEGGRAEIDSRTSDAIALAVRFNAPIYAYENVVEKAGIHLDVIEEEENIRRAANNFEDDLDILAGLESDLSDINEYEGWTKSELEAEMEKAVKNEDYELAARLRDQIDNMEN